MPSELRTEEGMALRTRRPITFCSALLAFALLVTRNAGADGEGPVFPWPIPPESGAVFANTRPVRGRVSRAIKFSGRGSHVDVGTLAGVTNL